MTDLRVIYEHPDFPDEPLQVLIPSPEWMMAAMAGDLPPICVYWQLEDAERRAIESGKHDGFQHSQEMWMQQFTAPRIGPMTEQEAISYLIMKDIPRRVWAEKHNRPMFMIVHKDQVPTNREFRNAWRLAA